MTNQKTLASLAVLVQSGQLDPVALTEDTLTRIENHADKSIFIGLTRDRAEREAKAASERISAGRSLGLLDGLPVAWKDLFDLAGSVTTAGSVVLKDNLPADRCAFRRP
jgi:aspartyl-tRNA(Asn)/glutamyl-tRNA(Gln) amidotransferase subunit A